jgi:drug/metabolite transporter (DMT)-like permease
LSKRTRAELLLLSCTLIWGSTFVVSKSVLDDVSPMLLIASRFLLGSLLLAIFVLPSLRRIPLATLVNGTILGALLFVGFATQTVGLQYTSASKSGFITGFLVVFAPIFQFLIERRPPRPGNVVGILLVLVGLFFLTSPEGSEFNVGDGLTLMCAVVFGLYIVYLDVFSKAHDVTHLALIQFVVAAVLAWSGVPFEGPRIAWNGDVMFVIAYLTVFATLYTLVIQTKYQKDSTPTRAAVIFSIEPVFAAVFAYFLLREMIGWLGVVGGTLIVTGLLVSELSDVLFPHRHDLDEGADGSAGG